MTTKTISGTYASGYTLRLPATVLSITASGYVGGYGVVARPSSGTDTVVNFGTIIGYHNGNPDRGGVNCNGVVVNGSPTATHAYISGEYFGVYADSVSNFGTIAGAYHQVGARGSGVLAAYLTNGSSSDKIALIDGQSGYGVSLDSGFGSPANLCLLTNYGTITGSEVGVENHTFGSSRVTNGSATDHQALIVDGVSFYSLGTVVNMGTIEGSQARAGEAISIGGGFQNRNGFGRVTNGSASDTTAQIYGSVFFAYGALTNYGTINFATGPMNYAAMRAGATSVVTNFGMIEGNPADHDTGVLLDGGTLSNGSSTNNKALISGYIGVNAYGEITVTNFGVIEGEGGDAIEFLSSGATLIVEAGSQFIGKVVDDVGDGVLVLANGSGTLTNAVGGGWVVSGDIPPATFTGFGTLDIASGATFAVSGALKISGGQTIDLSGTLAGVGKLYVAGGTANFSPGAALTVADVIVYNGSAINVGAAQLVYAGDWTQGVATLTVAAGGKMVFTGAADKFSGTLAGAGLVDFAAGADALDRVTIAGRTVITGTAVATLSGMTTLSTGALLSVTAPELLVARGGATLTGGGVLSLGRSSVLEGVTASATLVNEDDRISGGGALGGGQLVLVNDASGSIIGSVATALVIDTGANAVTNAGLIEATGSGGVVIKSAIDNTGTLFALGGNLTVDGAVSGAGGVRIRTATANFNVAFSEDVTFVVSGMLGLADSRAYRGTITGFSRVGATSLDLGDIAFGRSTNVSFSGTAASGVLTVTDGAHTAHITLIGNYLSSTFVASSDGHGGVTVVDSRAKDLPQALNTPSAPAFVAAMASLGAAPASAGSASEHAQPWRTQLMAPRVQVA
jgi:hypothetical protein